MSRPRVLLADDHRIVLAGLEALLRDDYELVGRAPDGRSLLEMARSTRCDFIVADISMPGLNGIDALLAMRREGLDVPVVFLTMHTEPAYARRESMRCVRVACRRATGRSEPWPPRHFAARTGRRWWPGQTL